MKARSLLLHAPHFLSWVDAELSPPGPEEILVRTEAGAISVGSELPCYLGAARAFLPLSDPKMTGYESVGRVIATGRDVEELCLGDRVVATYGHRTAALVRASTAIKIPDDVDDAPALLVILTCDVAKGLAKLKPAVGEPILVAGAGAIGLLTVWTLVQQGCGSVDVVEPIASRRELARDLGARHAFDPGNAPASAAYHCGVECSSANLGFQTLQRAMQPGGRICVLADGLLEPLALAPEFHERELVIVGSSDGLDYQDHARWYFPTALRAGVNLRRLFDLIVPAGDLPATFAHLATHRHTAIKVFVRYPEEPSFVAHGATNQ